MKTPTGPASNPEKSPLGLVPLNLDTLRGGLSNACVICYRGQKDGK